MSFDTHIRTRPKSLLHLYSSIWDAHQVLNPPFFPHVKKQKQTIFPGDNAPLPPPTPCPPHKISNAHPFHIFLLPCSKQNNNTRMPLAKRPYSVLFLFYFFFRAGETPIPPETFSVGLGLPPSSRTHSIIRLVKVPSIVQERMVEDTPDWLGREVGNELRYRLTPLDASALL